MVLLIEMTGQAQKETSLVMGYSGNLLLSGFQYVFQIPLYGQDQYVVKKGANSKIDSDRV